MTRISIVVRFLVAAALAPLILDSIAHRAVQAAIIVTGDSNPVYDNSDPWAPTDLIIGDTAPGSMTIDAGSVVNNTNSGRIANSSTASTSTVIVTGAGSSWTNSDSLYIGVSGVGTLTITDGGSVSSAFFGTINNGTVTVGGGAGTSSWTMGNPLSVGLNGAGTLNINTGGIVSALGVGTSSAWISSSSIRFDGGTLRITDTNLGANDAPTPINLLSGGGTFDIVEATEKFILTGAISGAGGLTKKGAGSLTLAGAISYAGGTTVSAGTLSIGNGNNTVGVPGDITNYGTVQFFRTNSFTYASVISGSGAVIQQGGGTLVLTGNNTCVGTTTVNHGTLRLGNGGTSGSVAGGIVNNALVRFDRSDNVSYGLISGTGAVTQEGTGTLTFTADNTYTGTTTIDDGTLSVGNGGTAGSIASASIVNDSALIFNRSDASTLPRAITGTGAVTKQGAGTLTLTGASSYDGTTTISAGALSLGNGGTSGSVTGAGITNNASLIFNRSDNVSFTRIINGSGSVTKQGAGILTLSRTNTYNGGTTVSAGTLQVTNTAGSGTGSGDIVVDSGATLAIGDGTNAGSVSGDITDNGAVRFNRSTGTITYAGQISGTGTVTKQGNSTLTLSSANTYGGNTTVSAGTLLVNNTITGSGNVTVASGATLGGTGGLAGNVSVNGILSPGASIESLGTGSLSFNQGSTFNYELSSGQLTADLVNATGGLSIFTSGSGVRFTLTQLATNVTLPAGTKFTVISYDGTWDGGTFAGIPELGKVSIGSNLYQMRYQDATPGVNFTNETSLNTTGRFVTITAIVPEPGAVILTAFALFAGAGLRRKDFVV